MASSLDDLSWEVMDVSEATESSIASENFLPVAKSSRDQEDWVLEPDYDDKKQDPEDAGDDSVSEALLPVIESITSLSGLDSKDADGDMLVGAEDKDDVEPALVAASEENSSAVRGKPLDSTFSEEESTDRLVIDMPPVSLGDSTMDQDSIRTRPVHNVVESDKKDQPIEQSAGVDTSTNGSTHSDELLNGHASERDQGAGEKAASQEKPRKSDNGKNKAKQGNRKKTFKLVSLSEDTETGSAGEGINGIVIADVQGAINMPDSEQKDEESADGRLSQDENARMRRREEGRITRTSLRKAGDKQKAAPDQVPTSGSGSPSEHFIVIDPEGPRDLEHSSDLINFSPGIIKLEDELNTSPPRAAPVTSTNTVATLSTETQVVTSAALSVATLLTTASPSTRATAATLNQPSLFLPQPSGLMTTGPRTILRSPPAMVSPSPTAVTIKKPLPQVLLRHGGPRTRPSYIRLGTHLARLSPPSTSNVSHAGAVASPQQRMISVLMDRSHGAITSTALPPSISQLIQASQSGAAAAAGVGASSSNPGVTTGANNAVKVLIIPSQSNVTTSGSGQGTQTSSLALASSSPAVFSLTTSAPVVSGSSSKKSGTAVSSTTNSRSAPTSSVSSSSKSKSQQSDKKSEKTNSNASGSDPKSTDISQIVSSMEERLKRRMLSKNNLIKEYHPSLSSGPSNVSFEFYPCHGCRDVFVNRPSLEQHKGRKSMVVRYNCAQCVQQFTFNNKCQFRCHMLKHVQELKLIHKNMLDRISLRALPFSSTKGKNGRTDSPSVDLGDLPGPAPTVETTEATKVGEETASATAASAPVSAAASITTEAGVEKPRAKPGDEQMTGPFLGLTIASVSSVSLDEHSNTETPTAATAAPAAAPVACASEMLAVSVSAAPSTSEIIQVTSSEHPTVTIVPSPALPPPLPLPIPTSHLPPPLAPPPPPMSSSQVHSPSVASLQYAAITAAVAAGAGGTGSQTPTTVASTTTVAAAAATATTSTTASMTPVPRPLQGDGGNIFCTECSATFSSYVNLQVHFNDVDKPHPLRPPCCSVRLATECCVRAHMRTHKKLRPFVCQDCGECFRGELAIFKKHTVNCQRVVQSAVIVYPCPRCRNWYSKIDQLRGHIRSHSESYLKCNLCPMAFKSVASFKEHNDTKHVGTKTSTANYTSIYKCPLCDSVFHDQRMKSEHLEQHINSIYAHQKVSFVCKMCEKLCYTYAMMRCHLKEKHSVTALGNMCDLCGMDCGSTIEGLVLHQRRFHNTFPANMLVDPKEFCPNNGKQSGGEAGDLGEGHLKDKKIACKEVSTEKMDDESVATCTSVSTRTSLESAPAAKSEGTIDTTESGRESGLLVSSDPPSQIKCHICCQVFKTRKALVRHKKADHGLLKNRRKRGAEKNENGDTKRMKPDPDDDEERLLDETSSQLQVKSNYMLRFECEHCDYRTPTFHDLQRHRADAHGVRARFPCHLCGLTYESAARLDDHVKATHEGQTREYPYLCWICIERMVRKGYAKRAHLVRHILNYHKVPSKAIDTARLDEMDRKVRIATDEKPDTGSGDMEPVDGGASSSGGSVSGGGGGDGSNNAPRRLKVDGDAEFRCAKCEFTCEERADFSEHIKKHKADVDSFQCAECGLCFSVLPPLKHHLRLVHKVRDLARYTQDTGVLLTNPPPPVPIEKVKTPVTRKSPPVGKDAFSSGKNPLECNVCYRTYADETALKNHMRTHGMAFIRSKRLAPVPFVTD